MAYAVTMPALSDTMGAGRLVKWTKNLGDKIRKGDVIAEVETDKAVMEVEAFQDGYLSGPLAAEGTEAPVGETIGYIADSAAEIASAAEVAAEPPPAHAGNGSAPAERVPAAPVSAVLAASRATQRPPRTPARSRAMAAHAEKAAAPPTTPAAAPRSALDVGPPYRIERASSLREAVARSMIAAAATPTFRVTAQLALEPLIKLTQERHYPLSLLLARACALVITAHPPCSTPLTLRTDWRGATRWILASRSMMATD